MVKIFALIDNKEQLELTKYCTGMSLSGDKEQCARKLSVSLVDPIFDTNHKRPKIEAGFVVWVVDEEDGEIFRGVIFSFEISSNQSIDFIAYDFMIYLLKSKGTFLFKDTSAKGAISEVCDTIGLTLGKTPSITSKISRIFHNKNLYVVIQSVLNEASKQNGKSYVCYMEEEKLMIDESGEKTVDIEVSSLKNIVTTNYSNSIDNMVNIVSVYDEKGGLLDEITNDQWMKKYGVIMAGYTKEDQGDYKGVAKNMLRGVEKELSIEMIGDIQCKTGSIVHLNVPYIDDLQSSFMYVKSDHHQWDFSTGKFVSKLTLGDLF